MRFPAIYLAGIVLSACSGQCAGGIGGLASPREPLSVEVPYARPITAGEALQVHARLAHPLAATATAARLFLEKPGERGMAGFVAEQHIPESDHDVALQFEHPHYRAPGTYDVVVRVYGLPEAHGQWRRPAPAERLSSPNFRGNTQLLAEARLTGAVEIQGKLRSLWSRPIADSSIASPALVDINGSGVLDIIVGTGREIFYGHIVALDGRDGSELWRWSAGDEVVSSAALAQVRGETWLFNGGRAGNLVALRASDGKLMWEHRLGRWVASPAVADLFGNGRPTVVATAGGSSAAFFPGILSLHDAETGRILWEYREPPGGMEYYASPAVGDLTGNGFADIVIGSGGERLPGATIAFAGDGSGFRMLWEVPTETKGVEASPLLVDLDGSGTLDVITAGMDGFVKAIRGWDGTTLWRRDYPGYEFYPSPGIGTVDGDGRLTVVAAASYGHIHAYSRGLLVAIDAQTGEERWSLEAGHMAGGSPLLIDTNGDGRDEIITSMSGYRRRGEAHSHPGRLLILRGRDGHVLDVAETPGIAMSTPTVADLDGNGSLDIVTTSYQRDNVSRFATSFRVPERRGWPKFRGDDANIGVYQRTDD